MQQPIAWETVENALRAFLRDACDLTDDRAVWGKQSAPRPNYPYATLNIISGPNPIGIDEKVFEAANSETTNRGVREMTVQFSALALRKDEDNLLHARAYATAIVSALEDPTYNHHFRDVGLAVRAIMPIALPDEQVALSWLSHGIVDVRFGLSSNITYPVDYFDNVVITPTITP